MSKTALLGATGAIGESIAAELRKRGESYRAVGRDRASLERTFGSDPLAEIAVWNPDDASSVRAASRADAADARRGDCRGRRPDAAGGHRLPIRTGAANTGA